MPAYWLLIGFGCFAALLVAILRFGRKKEVWTVRYAGDADDGCFFDYDDYENEEAARKAGLKLQAPILIRRPDGTNYQLSFLPHSHVTDTKIQKIIHSKQEEWNGLVEVLERHVTDCAECRKKYLNKVRAVSAMRSGSLPLLNLSQPHKA